jgi:hypothetical protein
MSPVKRKLPRKSRSSFLFARRRAHVARQAHHVLQRVVVGAQHVQLLLGKVADVQALAFGDGAAQRRQRIGDGLDQRGLALAVGAQDADALAGQHLRLMLPHDEPSGSISSCLGPASTWPATQAPCPGPAGTATVRSASAAATKSAKPAPMFSVP